MPNPVPANTAFYIHTPFCASRCAYCDFKSGLPADDALMIDYAHAVCRETGMLSDHHGEHTGLRTLYFGGGTPSLLPLPALERMISAVQGLFFCRLEEVTIEANPNDVTPEKARAWKDMGINRVSLGFQSFDDSVLKKLSRRNTEKDNFNSFEILRAAGFDNISADIILAVPGDSLESLQKLLRLSPEHISAYLLTIEGDTLLSHETALGVFSPLPDDEQARLYESTGDKFQKAGYERYEVSNYARGPEYRSIHNSLYWKGAEYLAAGAGAVGTYRTAHDRLLRYTNLFPIAPYMETVRQGRLPVETDETLDQNTRLKELIMLGLRTSDGISLERCVELTGNTDIVSRLVRAALRFPTGLEINSLSISPTPAGMLLSNTLAVEMWKAAGLN